MSGENVVLGLLIIAPLAGFEVFLLCVQKRRAAVPGRGIRWLTAGNAALFFSLSFLVLLGGELYFRFWYDESDSFTLTLTGKKWLNRHYRYNNSTKVRDSLDYTLEIPAGKTRVTFIGDSFTAGQGVADVEQRFANRIRAAKPNWDVHVLGFNGLESVHVPRLLGDIEPLYRFENVVLVYTLNDISLVMPEYDQMISKVYDGKDLPFPLAQSYFLNTLYFRWKRAHIPEVQDFFRFTLAAYNNPATWKTQQSILARIKSEVEARGGRLFVVTFPFLHSLGPGYEFRGVHRQLAEFWKEQGVPNLDLLDVFESAAPGPLTADRYDAHPNERAHALAVEPIARFLDSYLRPQVEPQGRARHISREIVAD